MRSNRSCPRIPHPLCLICLALLVALGCASPEPPSDSAESTGTEAPTAASQEVNVYSARHYDADQTLYDRFAADTGIEVNVIEGDSAALLERLRREDEQSPADLFITVDAGRLNQAEKEGIFQPTSSQVLDQRVPASLRHPEGLWFGLTKRARVIVYAKDRVSDQELPATYEELAQPQWNGRVLIRSSSNIYNQSLVGSILAAAGDEATEAWCRGLVENMARTPQGGDRDQIRAIAAGEGDIAIVNTYYLAQMISAEDKPEDQEAAAKIGVVFPNQGDRGTHVNISGAGVVRGAPNPDNAVRLLEYLTGDEAQNVFAGGNKEYPVVPTVAPVPELVQFGEFQEDSLNASEFAARNIEALKLMDRCGWR
ncbi:MAG: Fe(3+) ABC transporter substrate-binding protein [Acidobacteriota bacterium]